MASCHKVKCISCAIATPELSDFDFPIGLIKLFRSDAIDLALCEFDVYDEMKSIVEINENIGSKIAVFQYHDEDGLFTIRIFNSIWKTWNEL